MELAGIRLLKRTPPLARGALESLFVVELADIRLLKQLPDKPEEPGEPLLQWVWPLSGR